MHDPIGPCILTILQRKIPINSELGIRRLREIKTTDIQSIRWIGVYTLLGSMRLEEDSNLPQNIESNRSIGDMFNVCSADCVPDISIGGCA